MKIVDARPVKNVPTPTFFRDIKIGDLYYDKRFTESIFIKTSNDMSVDLIDGTEIYMTDTYVVKKVKGHLVVEEIEE